MAELKELNLWIRYKEGTRGYIRKKQGEPTQTGIRWKGMQRIVIPAKDQSPVRLKLEIAKILHPIKEQIEYYYVVAVRESNGIETFRTVVPKTLVV